MDTSLQKGFMSWKQKQNLCILKSMLSKIMAFLSFLSFYKNNVQMSLVEINTTQEFLISLEQTRKYIFFQCHPKYQFFKIATYPLCLITCLFAYLFSSYSNK